MNDDPNIIPDGASPLRFILSAAAGSAYQHYTTLAEAHTVEGAVAIMEGDFGGQIYLACPVDRIHCEEVTLSLLLADLDSLCWDQPEGSGLYFEVVPVGATIPGGMGGGLVVDGIWLHDELEPYRHGIEAVVSGISLRIR